MSRDEEEERLHFQKVQNSFRSYKKHSLAAVHRREDYLGRLPKEHQRLLRKHGYQDTLDDLKEAVEQNSAIISDIMADVEGMFENVSHQARAGEDQRVRPSQLDMDKVQSTLKQLVRDWSSAGAGERQQCYSPILAALQGLHPTREDMEMMLLSEDQDKPPEITKMTEKFREELEKTETGSVALLFKGKLYFPYFI